MAYTRRLFGPQWSPLQQLQSEVNRLFQNWSDPATPGSGGNFPTLNAWEERDALHLTAELPGLSMQDLEIYVTDNRQLTIKGERKRTVPEKAVRHREERGFGKFARVLTLPFAVDAERVEARLENGVLYLKLAKHESAKPRKTQVKGE
jgi:HSP20 family protein